MACLCGAQLCHRRNTAFFFRRQRWAKRNVRAVVFVWPDQKYWTWCPVVNGEPWDTGQAMGHYDDAETAWADADAWTRGEFGSRREAAA